MHLAGSCVPFCVIGTGGSVSTGAVDPLPEISALCREKASGSTGRASAVAAVPEAPDAAALAHADSVAIDPHKWLCAPLEAGCALVRTSRRCARRFRITRPTTPRSATNYVDLFRTRAGFVRSKSGRCGAGGRLPEISDDILLSRTMADGVRAHATLLVTQDQHHDIACLRFAATLGESRRATLNELNEALLDRVQAAAKRSCRTPSCRALRKLAPAS
jgi:hypothetical protein